jgi:hypothetical protein
MQEKTALMEALMRGIDPKTARKQLRLKREEEEQQRQALHAVNLSGTAALKVCWSVPSSLLEPDCCVGGSGDG